MGETLKEKKTIELIKVIPKFPNKIITYEQKKINIKFLMNVIYKVFYVKDESLVTAEDIVEELVDQNILDNEVIGKFSNRVMKKYLWKSGQDILISIPNIDECGKCIGRCNFYPFALVLKTENDGVYDFTSTRELYPIRLSSIFDANFEKISKIVVVNICEPPIKLKDFLESYDKEDHKIILNILIKIAKNGNMKKRENRERREVLYNSQNELEEAVSKEFEKYKRKYFNLLPHYPEELKQFVTENRSYELKKALKYLEKHRSLLISGVGGVGKSTLARALVDYSSKTVPKPFWFNFNQNQDTKLNDILEKLASYLNASDIVAFKGEKREPGKNDVDKLINELQRRKEIWLIFDDLSTVLEDQHFIDKGIELLFSSLRYNIHNAKIIVTSRILPILKNGESLLDVVEEEEKHHLNGLETNFAIDYLARNGLNEVEPEKLEELAKGVDGHPLALKLLIELVKECGAADILEDLNMYQEKKEDTIKKARRLFDKLAGNEKKLIERVSVYREPVSIKGLKEMFTGDTSKDAVKKLIDKSLLETNHKGNYWLHPLIQEFSYKDLKNKKEVHKIAYSYYSSLPLLESPLKKEDLQPAIEAHHHACGAAEYELAAQIILKSKLHFYLDIWGDYTTLTRMFRQLLPDDPFQNEVNLSEKMKSFVFGELGSSYRQLGFAKEALLYHEKALRITRETGEKCEGIDHLVNIGTSYRYLGETVKGIDCYKQALEIARDIGDLYKEVYILGNLGYEFYYWGDLQKEIERYESAIIIAKEIQDKEKEGEFLALLGTVYSNQGKHKEAIEYCTEAVEIAKKLKIRHLEEFLGYLGFSYRCSGNLDNLDKALDCYKQALNIAVKIKDRIGEGRRRGSIGIVYSIRGETQKAIG